MFVFKTKKSYEIKQELDLEDCEQLLADDGEACTMKQSQGIRSRTTSWLTTVLLVLFTALTSFAFGAWGDPLKSFDSMKFCTSRVSQYCKARLLPRSQPNFSNEPSAPIVKDVGITYGPLSFNGSLLRSNEFRLDAGPEVDTAWKSLGADCMARTPS